MKQPLVSVIIPTLPTRKRELEAAITSVKLQTYKNIELIIETGGQNVQDARNIAAKKAKGKYIAFLDDDDIFYPDKIKEQVKFMESDKNMGLSITWGDDFRFDIYHQYQPKRYWTFNELISGFNITCTSTYMIRKDIFDAIGGMDDTLVDSHEYDLAIRVSQIASVQCLQKSLVMFCDAHGTNWSYNYGRKITGMIQFVKKWGKYFGLMRWLNSVMCFGLFTIALRFPKPVEKLFTLTKMKMERIGKLEKYLSDSCIYSPNFIERFKA